MTPEEELDVRVRVAEAKLAVVDELRWALGPCVYLAVHDLSHSWVWSIGIAAIAFLFLPRPFSKEYKQAEDAYEKLTQTGKYARMPIKSPDTTRGK